MKSAKRKIEDGGSVAEDVDEYVYRVGYDFSGEIEDALDEVNLKKKSLAGALAVTPGRISQVLNNPGNLTLTTIVRMGMAVGKKTAVVVYDDHRPFAVGPISTQVFQEAWDRAGRPVNMFDFEEEEKGEMAVTVASIPRHRGAWTNAIGGDAHLSLLFGE